MRKTRVCTYGKLDIAFNNAGVEHGGATTDSTEEDFHRVVKPASSRDKASPLMAVSWPNKLSKVSPSLPCQLPFFSRHSKLVPSQLLPQFFQDSTNTRHDDNGGSVENRARLMLKAVDAAISVWGADRVGVSKLVRG